MKKIAKEYGLSTAGISRHKTSHLASELTAESRHLMDDTRRGDLLKYTDDLLGRSLRILDAAEAAPNISNALKAIRESRETIRLLAQLTNQLVSTSPVTNVFVSSDWQRVCKKLLVALESYPDARLAVIAALGGSMIPENTIDSMKALPGSLSLPIPEDYLVD